MEKDLISEILQQYYDDVVDRNGTCCTMCNKSSEKEQLVVDTISKDPNDTDSNSMILSCKGCFIKNLSRRLSEVCVSERKRVSVSGSVEKELSVNRQKEPKFKLFVYQILGESIDAKWEEKDLVNSAAEEVAISPITARRYLDKLCSSRGVLKRIEVDGFRYVSFKLDDFAEIMPVEA